MVPAYIMESEEHDAVMLGRVDEETVFVNDTYLIIWSLIMYALGTFTGMLLYTTAFMSMI